MKLRSLLVMLILLCGAVFFVACEGKDGKDGVDGKDGAQGPVGPKGDKGDPGPAGADGRVGDQGPGYGDSRCDVSNGIQGIVGIAQDNLTGTDEDDVIKDFDLTEDMIYFRNFATGGETITVESGKLTVGGTDVVIHGANGSPDNIKAGKIKSEKNIGL